MYAITMTFGKYEGRELSQIPDSYLRWAMGANATDPWLKDRIKVELASRGARFVDAEEILTDVEQTIEQLVADDRRIPHEGAGWVTDHVLDALDQVRARHWITRQTELIIPARRPALCPRCQDQVRQGG